VAVEQQQIYLNAYQREARNALQRFINGECADTFLLQALEHIRTYLQIPRRSTTPLLADSDIARLAQAIQTHLFDRGFWRQLLALWPPLITLAEQLPEPIIYAELVKQLAMIKDRQGDGEATHLLYTKLLTSPQFPKLPIALQADVLQQRGTTLVWQGELTTARSLLDQVLSLVQQHPIDQAPRSHADQYGVRSNLEVTPLWESKAYALNQLGNIAMFQGRFKQAERLYIACWQTINKQGEAENLACVAHQALGRLWLHWGRVEQAMPILEKGIAIRRRRQDRAGVAINLIYLAAALLQERQLDQAEALLTEALPITRSIDNRRDTGLCHLYFGQLDLLCHRHSDALAQWQQALTYFQTVHTPLIEQRVFIFYSPWLLLIGERAMLRTVTNQLFKSLRQQGLTTTDWIRLFIRLNTKF
jgi:tetratricopeptide (TPR) repeat protein